MANDAVVFDAPHSVAIEDRAVPEPKEGEVLIETKRTLVSTGTELTNLTGEEPSGRVRFAHLLSVYFVDCLVVSPVLDEHRRLDNINEGRIRDFEHIRDVLERPNGLSGNVALDNFVALGINRPLSKDVDSVSVLDSL